MMKVMALAASIFVLAGSAQAAAEELLMLGAETSACFEVFVAAKNSDGATILEDKSGGALKRYIMITGVAYYDFTISTKTEIVTCYYAVP